MPTQLILQLADSTLSVAAFRSAARKQLACIYSNALRWNFLVVQFMMAEHGLLSRFGCDHQEVDCMRLLTSLLVRSLGYVNVKPYS